MSFFTASLQLTHRPRRLRRTPWLRDLVAETNLRVEDLIWPVFITHGKDIKEPIASMPGVFRYSLDLIGDVALQASELGIRALALFPNTPSSLRTEDAKEALNPDNLICLALQRLKEKVPHVGLITDVALDPYTSHGHDGLLKDGSIANDETVEILARQAVLQAEAGADILAPSDMMDGRIGAIRQALDTAGFEDRALLSYAAKYASVFYGPFRDAVGTMGMLKGDKKTYQMNPANTDEAIREVALDLDEGADMVMVKPGMPYLDVIQRVKAQFAVPTFAYQVSGEYAMIKAAAANGWLDHDAAMMESLLAFKRAGADGILTYFAPQAAALMATRMQQ